MASENIKVPDENPRASVPREENPGVETQRGGGLSGKLFLVVLVLVAAVLAALGIAKRKQSAGELAKYTSANAAPTVSLVVPPTQNVAQEIVLPGNMQAFTMAPIYARTTGYVKSWFHDIGSHVRRGELLAIIETPELDQQLAQAKADLDTAKANAGLAKITASRYQDLLGDKAVSEQETDNAVNQLKSSTTQVASAEANVRRLQELQAFEHIVAPFDGVITARNLDVGQLIAANGSTLSTGAGIVSSSRQVFDIAKIEKLRVFINVPQQYAPNATNGSTATLTLPQYPSRTFRGVLVRTSNAVDPVSRTLLAEVDVDNRSGELLPGSYAEVHLHVNDPAPARIVPVSALMLLPDGMRVATVDSSHRARLLHVTVGRDMGSTAEITSGLPPGQAIVPNPPDSLTDGEDVRVVEVGKNSMGQVR